MGEIKENGFSSNRIFVFFFDCMVDLHILKSPFVEVFSLVLCCFQFYIRHTTYREAHAFSLSNQFLIKYENLISLYIRL